MIFYQTQHIILSYLNLLLYKIFPIIIPLSIIGIDSLLFSAIQYLVFGYMYFNLIISDILLRQTIKIYIIKSNTNISNNEHNCDYCSKNIVWNLQDIITNLVFNIIGTYIFRKNIYLDIYWRSYLHTLPIAIKNKLCVQQSIYINWIGIIGGFINYFLEKFLSYYFPFVYVLFFMLFLNFIIDCFIFELDIKSSTSILSPILLKIIWKFTQCIIIGWIELKKRTMQNNNMILEILHWFVYLKNNTYYRFIFWKEFQSLDLFVSYGESSIFYREHVLNLFELLLNIKYLIDNQIVKFARKTKLLHISSFLKPYLSSENKFYISLFEARKEIEPFLNDIIKDIESSILHTKIKNEYEEFYNDRKKIESSINIMESYYK